MLERLPVCCWAGSAAVWGSVGFPQMESSKGAQVWGCVFSGVMRAEAPSLADMT